MRYFQQHLGLGDHLICAGLVRELAKHETLVTFAKPHNYQSVAHLFSGDENVQILSAKNDDIVTMACDEAEAVGFEVIRNGMHNRKDTFNIERWDREFYRQAGVPFEQSWEGWRVPACEGRSYPDKPYAFVHEDHKRGYLMNAALIPKDLVIVCNEDSSRASIFEWVETIRNATEIHVMESCFAILADRLDGLKARRLCVHAYMRNSRPPVYRKTWEILR